MSFGAEFDRSNELDRFFHLQSSIPLCQTTKELGQALEQAGLECVAGCNYPNSLITNIFAAEELDSDLARVADNLTDRSGIRRFVVGPNNGFNPASVDSYSIGIWVFEGAESVPYDIIQQHIDRWYTRQLSQ